MAKPKKSKRMQMFDQLAVPPTPERIARGEMVTVEVRMHDKHNMATLDRRATALDRFWRDMLLAPEGDVELGRARYDAGTKLAHLYEVTGLRQRETGNYGPRENAFEEMTDEQASAFASYSAVMRVLRSVSIGAASAVVNLCVHDREHVDRRELIRGLDKLVRYWGLD